MKVILLLVLSLSSGLLVAQCPEVKGTVVDKDTKEALPGASILSLSDKLKGTTSDMNGAFMILATVNDQLKVSFIGYETQVVRVDSSCHVTLLLASSNTNLNEMTIQAERLIAEEFTITKLSKLSIYKNPGAKADPLLAVNTLPAATTLDESASISLRGADPAETGIFLNNVPVNDAVRYAQLNGIGTFSIFNTAIIHQMLVYPGNPPLEFGNTTSGLISLNTDDRPVTKNSNSLTVSLASIGFLNSHKLSDKSSLTTFTNFQPSAAIKFINAASLERLKKFNTVDLGLHYVNRLNKKSLLKIFSYSNAESFSYETHQASYSGNFNQEKWRTFLILNYRQQLRFGELSLNTGLTISSARFQLSIIDTRLRPLDYYSSLAYHYVGKSFELKTGLTYDYRSTSFAGKIPQYDFAMGEDHPTITVASNQYIQVPETFVYAKYHLTEKWQVGTGFRKNVRTQNNINYLSSQLNISYKPQEPWSIIFSIGEYNKIALSQNNYTDLLHYSNRQYSLDISRKSQRLENSIALYYKEGNKNTLQTSVKGIELYTRYELIQKLRIDLALTSLDASQTEIQSHAQASRYDINYIIRHTIEYKFLSSWTVAAVLMRRQGSFHNPVIASTYYPELNAYEPSYGEPQRLPDYFQFDMSLSKLLLMGKRGTAIIFLSTGNVANVKNLRSYNYNFDYSSRQQELFSLRTFYAGFTVNF